MEPVVDIEDLSAEWLASVLDVEVRSVTHERIGAGQTGASYRLALDADALPSTLVAKVAAGPPEARQLVGAGYRNEVGFYSSLVTTLDVHVPRCWYAAISDDMVKFTLLLEDLAPRVPGVQVDGCSLANAEAAIRNLAGLHAPRWNDPSLRDLDFVSGPSADSEEAAFFLGEVTKSAVAVFVDRYQSRLDDLDVETLRASADATATWLIARRDPFSVLHGDYRLDNLMFGQDGDEVAAVDWQTLAIAPPGRDVAYFLSTSLDPAERRAAEEHLVGVYHGRLLARGVTDYSADRCFEDYRLGLLQAPLITSIGAVYAPAERTEAAHDMFCAMARRSCAAIRELDPFALL